MVDFGRKVRYSAYFVLLFIVVFLVGGVGYSHWSLRQLAAPLPSIEEVLKRSEVSDGPISISYITTATIDDSQRGEIVFPSFVLEWGDGRRFLVDLGMDESGAVAYFNKMGWQYNGDAIESHGSVGEQLNSAYPSIYGIGVTHLHPDHVQGIESFCREDTQQISLFQTATQAERNNYTTAPGTQMLGQASCIEAEVLNGDVLKPVPGFSGLFVIAVAGHSPGSSVFLASVQGKLWVLAGDVSWQHSLMLRNEPKKVSFARSVLIPEHEGRLAELRHWLNQLNAREGVEVVLCHDGDALEKYGPPKYQIINRL